MAHLVDLLVLYTLVKPKVAGSIPGVSCKVSIVQIFPICQQNLLTQKIYLLHKSGICPSINVTCESENLRL